jgi:antitoxin YefM
MKTANYTDLRNTYPDGAVMDYEPLIIHRSANTGVVTVSTDEYSAVKETEYLMSSPEMMDWLRKSEESMKSGKGTKIDIDAL